MGLWAHTRRGGHIRSHARVSVKGERGLASLGARGCWCAVISRPCPGGRRANLHLVDGAGADDALQPCSLTRSWPAAPPQYKCARTREGGRWQAGLLACTPAACMPAPPTPAHLADPAQLWGASPRPHARLLVTLVLGQVSNVLTEAAEAQLAPHRVLQAPHRKARKRARVSTREHTLAQTPASCTHARTNAHVHLTFQAGIAQARWPAPLCSLVGVGHAAWRPQQAYAAHFRRSSPRGARPE